MTFLTTTCRGKLGILATTLHLALPVSANSGLQDNPLWEDYWVHLEVLEPALIMLINTPSKLEFSSYL